MAVNDESSESITSPPEWWWTDLNPPARCTVAAASAHVGRAIRLHLTVEDFELAYVKAFPFGEKEDRVREIGSLVRWLGSVDGPRKGVYSALTKARDGFIAPIIDEIVTITGEDAEAVAAAARIPEEFGSSRQFDDLRNLMELSSIAVRGLTSPNY